MANILPIHDPSDPALEVYAGLTETKRRSRLEPEKGVFIAESPKVITSALNAGCVPLSLLMEEKHLTGQGAPLIARCGELPVYTGSRETLSGLTGYALTRGILCAMRRPRPMTAEEVCRNARRVAVLWDIVDATNIGAIVRSAAALNMDGVLFSPSCCDPLCRRAVRVSMGTVFQLPWARLGSLEELSRLGFRTVAMALTDDSVPVDDPRLAKEEKLAILLGTEGDGLSREAIAACDHTARIPMSHGVDSLNVAAASAVAFWTLARRD